jgi:hypothetical protein
LGHRANAANILLAIFGREAEAETLRIGLAEFRSRSELALSP